MRPTITLKISAEDHMSIRNWLLEQSGADAGSSQDNLAEYVICYLFTETECFGINLTVEQL